MDDRQLCLVLLGTVMLGALYGVLRAYAAYLVRMIRHEERGLRQWQSEVEMCAHDVRTQKSKNSRD